MKINKDNKFYTIAAIVSTIYLLNLTFGVDLIPDNLPIIGNLDEVAFTVALLKSIKELKS